MNRKKIKTICKIITVCIFLALILYTIVITMTGAVKENEREIQNHDIMPIGAGIIVVIGGFVVLCETDLFCTVWYFAFGKKRAAKTVFCVLAFLCLALIAAYSYFSDDYTILRKYEVIPYILFALFVIFRFVYFAFSVPALTDESSDGEK